MPREQTELDESPQAAPSVKLEGTKTLYAIGE